MKIASVEDDPSQADLIQQILTGASYECVCYPSAEAFRSDSRIREFDMLILDWNLPDMTGVDLAKWTRATLGDDIPILFITNRTLEDDIVQAIRSGADDYITKPIRRNEMIARIRAIFRRTSPPEERMKETLVLGRYELDITARNVKLNGEEIDVSPREFDLALFFFRNVGQLVSRDAIERAVWGRRIGKDSRTLDTHLSRLRLKLSIRPENGVRLTSIYSHGFRFENVPSPKEREAPVC